MTTGTRIAVLGAAGKMGRAIVRATGETAGARLVAAVDRAGSPELGQDAGTLAGTTAAGVAVSTELPGKGGSDVWIDFTAPAATVAHARAAADAGAAMVIGTTGLSAEDRVVIEACATRVPIVLAPNMSVGVTVLLKLVTDAARALGPSYDIEIVEAHHRMKRDAPSGTALRLAEAAAEGAGRKLDEVACYERKGDVGPRPPQEIGIQTIRGGDVVGDHTVFFLGVGERIELTHKASSRDTFARGAVRAALWVTGCAPGIYDMRDVLDIR
jgi:4-hydroxy-tetrahydrodipicolinate reductase